MDVLAILVISSTLVWMSAKISKIALDGRSRNVSNSSSRVCVFCRAKIASFSENFFSSSDSARSSKIDVCCSATFNLYDSSLFVSLSYLDLDSSKVAWHSWV